MKNDRDRNAGKPDRDRSAGNEQTNDMTKQDQSAPGWADGLRQLYDSVVDEPLPDTFKDLLSKLDDKP